MMLISYPIRTCLKANQRADFQIELEEPIQIPEFIEEDERILLRMDCAKICVIFNMVTPNG